MFKKTHENRPENTVACGMRRVNVVQRRCCSFKPGLTTGIGQRNFLLNNPILAAAVLSCLFGGTNVAHAAFNIPTATVDPVTGLFTPEPSPLCINSSCATPFTAKMLLFEEFGLKKMSDSSLSTSSFPQPLKILTTLRHLP